MAHFVFYTDWFVIVRTTHDSSYVAKALSARRWFAQLLLPDPCIWSESELRLTNHNARLSSIFLRCCVYIKTYGGICHGNNMERVMLSRTCYKLVIELVTTLLVTLKQDTKSTFHWSLRCLRFWFRAFHIARGQQIHAFRSGRKTKNDQLRRGRGVVDLPAGVPTEFVSCLYNSRQEPKAVTKLGKIGLKMVVWLVWDKIRI